MSDYYVNLRVRSSSGAHFAYRRQVIRVNNFEEAYKKAERLARRIEGMEEGRRVSFEVSMVSDGTQHVLR